MSLSQSLATPSHLTLLTPHTHTSHPPLSRDGITRLGYQLLYPAETDPGLIELGTDGTIRTAGINGHALVMVTTFESGFNRSVSLHVEVCPVASLALTPHPSLPQATPTSRYHSFPLGYSAEFRADLHDNDGRKFSRSAINIDYRLNRQAQLHETWSGHIGLSTLCASGGYVHTHWWLTLSHSYFILKYICSTVEEGLRSLKDQFKLFCCLLHSVARYTPTL